MPFTDDIISEQGASRLANNVWMVLLSRIGMLILTVFLPIAFKVMLNVLESQGHLEQTVAVWQARTDGQIDSIKAQLATLLAAPKYSPQDAERDLKLRDLQLKTLEQRIQDLEHELRQKVK